MNLNESQIRNIVRQEIATQQNGSRFGITPTSNHSHTGIDSPYVFQPVLTYVGRINADATVALLPTSWTVVNSGTGIYTITHNLNTILYSVTANCLFTGTRNVLQITNLSTDSFTVNTFFYNPTTLENSGFAFILTNISNSIQAPVKYIGTST